MPKVVDLVKEEQELSGLIKRCEQGQRMVTLRLDYGDMRNVVRECLDRDGQIVTTRLQEIVKEHYGKIHIELPQPDRDNLRDIAAELGLPSEAAAAERLILDLARDYLAHLQGRAVYDRGPLDAAVERQAKEAVEKDAKPVRPRR